MKGSPSHVDFCLEDVGELISHGELLCLTMSVESRGDELLPRLAKGSRMPI